MSHHSGLHLLLEQPSLVQGLHLFPLITLQSWSSHNELLEAHLSLKLTCLQQGQQVSNPLSHKYFCKKITSLPILLIGHAWEVPLPEGATREPSGPVGASQPQAAAAPMPQPQQAQETVHVTPVRRLANAQGQSTWSPYNPYQGYRETLHDLYTPHEVCEGNSMTISFVIARVLTLCLYM